MQSTVNTSEGIGLSSQLSPSLRRISRACRKEYTTRQITNTLLLISSSSQETTPIGSMCRIFLSSWANAFPQCPYSPKAPSKKCSTSISRSTRLFLNYLGCLVSRTTSLKGWCCGRMPIDQPRTSHVLSSRRKMHNLTRKLLNPKQGRRRRRKSRWIQK